MSSVALSVLRIEDAEDDAAYQAGICRAAFAVALNGKTAFIIHDMRDKKGEGCISDLQALAEALGPVGR